MATPSRRRAEHRASEQSCAPSCPSCAQRKGHLVKRSRLLVAAVSLAATVGVVAPPATEAAATTAPLWVKHVQNFADGISNGVRFSLDPTVMQTQAGFTASVGATASAATTATSLNNVQMNDDSYPPLPQNEESVAYSTDDPMVAVAGANDYVSGGTVVMRTWDGGRTWASTRVVPVFRPTRDICNGGDPSVAYSSRDHAFYLAQRCFFRQLPQSEVPLTNSVENGGTLDIGYILEECNTSLDHGLRFKQSTDGGASFGTTVHVNKPGQWADNPNTSDLIPNTAFRTPNTISLAYSGATGTLAFGY